MDDPHDSLEPAPLIQFGRVFSEALDLFVRWWPWLAFATLVGATGGALVFVRSPEFYMAETKIFVDDYPIASAALPNQVEVGVARRAELKRRIEVIRSIPVADAALQLADGRAAPETPPEELEPAAAIVGGRDLEVRLKQPGYLARLLELRSSISIGGDFDNSMIVISSSGPDPAEVSRRVNNHALAYRRVALAQRTGQAAQVLAHLATAAQEGARQLAQAEALEKAAPRDAAARLAQVRALVRDQRQLLAELRQLAHEATTSLGPAGGTKPPGAPEGEAREPAAADLDELAAALTALEASLQADLAGRAAEPERTARACLERMVAHCDRAYSLVLSHRKQLAVRISLATSGVHQVDPATVPTAPAGPLPGPLVLNGALIGFAFALVTLLALENAGTTVRGQHAIARVTRAPVLGVVISDDGLRTTRSGGGILMHDHATTPTAETFRDVRNALKFAQVPARSILVTSASVAEGKTTLATNLAISFAHLGERVLLIDADLRRPRLHTLFGVANETGMSRLAAEPGLAAQVRPTAVPGLSLLTSGPPLANPAEFLCAKSFETELRALAAGYDRVLIDSSPLNAVSDAGVLGPLVDGVVLVVRDRTCTETTLTLAMDRLRASRCRLLGVIVNDIKASAASGYGYGYGYGATAADTSQDEAVG